MVGAYLDASILLAVLLEEPASADVDVWMSEIDLPLLVSDLAAAEVSSALSLAARMQREPTASAERRLADFDKWRTGSAVAVEIAPEDIRTADQFVRRFDLKLKAPDAIHAATAHRIGAILITLDHRLLYAASALGVEAFAPMVRTPKKN